jgi:hypothetical protein
MHRRRDRIEWSAIGDVLLGGPHHSPEESGDRNRVVDQRAGVTGAQFQGRYVRGWSHVEKNAILSSAMTPVLIRSAINSSYSRADRSRPVAPAVGHRCQIIDRMLA